MDLDFWDCFWREKTSITWFLLHDLARIFLTMNRLLHSTCDKQYITSVSQQKLDQTVAKYILSPDKPEKCCQKTCPQHRHLTFSISCIHAFHGAYSVAPVSWHLSCMGILYHSWSRSPTQKKQSAWPTFAGFNNTVSCQKKTSVLWLYQSRRAGLLRTRQVMEGKTP